MLEETGIFHNTITMSDGNFNTKLLAPGGFASGVRAGEARMKQRALQAFKDWMATADERSDEDKRLAYEAFKSRLD